MATTERNATTVWTGDVQNGAGTVTGGTGTFSGIRVSLPTRIGEADGNSSPEEFLAAAHSSCLAMNLSATLTQNGTPPERIDAQSTVGVAPKSGGGLEVTHSHVTISARVPGMSNDDFQSLAKKAEETCPVSNALRNNLEITLDARLES